MIREASFSDFSAVAAVKKRGGLLADSFENWERLWRYNPALRERHDRPIGWVLEAEGAVVGYLGNISLLYGYGNQTLTAVVSHGLVVDPPYRAMSMSLVGSFFRQKSVDLYLSTTAIESVGKIAMAFKSSPLPQPEYGTVYFWVLRPGPFAEGLIRKLDLERLVSAVSRFLVSAAVRTDNILQSRVATGGSTACEIREMSVDQIGDEFLALWKQKLEEGPRLLADRAPATLRWHYEIPGDRGFVRVFTCYQAGLFVGYAVVRSDVDARSGMRKSMIADVIARRDDPEIVKALCVAAYDYARRLGSAILEVIGFPPGIRKVFSEWHPYERKLPACPFFYKATDPALHNKLLDPMAWYACPFDGDTTLIRPSYSDTSLPSVSGEYAGRHSSDRAVPDQTLN